MEHVKTRIEKGRIDMRNTCYRIVLYKLKRNTMHTLFDQFVIGEENLKKLLYNKLNSHWLSINQFEYQETGGVIYKTDKAFYSLFIERYELAGAASEEMLQALKS